MDTPKAQDNPKAPAAPQALRIGAVGVLCVGALRLFFAQAYLAGAASWLIEENHVSDDEAAGMLALAVWGLGCAASGLVMVLAGVGLARRRSPGLGRLAGALALLPCSPCCLLEVPFGAWLIYTLSQPDVEQLFDPQPSSSDRP